MRGLHQLVSSRRHTWVADAWEVKKVVDSVAIFPPKKLTGCPGVGNCEEFVDSVAHGGLSRIGFGVNPVAYAGSSGSGRRDGASLG